jgi:hypothetical protein
VNIIINNTGEEEMSECLFFIPLGTLVTISKRMREEYEYKTIRVIRVVGLLGLMDFL